jgi:hypothetical protein
MLPLDQHPIDVHAYLDKPLYTRLVREAAANQEPITEVVIRALRQYYERQDQGKHGRP